MEIERKWVARKLDGFKKLQPIGNIVPSIFIILLHSFLFSSS